MLTVLALLAACAPTLPSLDTGDTATPTGATPPCRPLATADDARLLEGDAVRIRVACGSGEDPARYVAMAGNPPHGAFFDTSTWTFTWDTDLADGGRYDLLFAVYPREGGSGMPETAVATVWVADAIDDPANEAPDPRTYSEEWGVPVIHVLPASSIPWDGYVPATVVFDGTAYDAEIALRGAVSRGYPKPGYTLRFADGQHLDASPWGISGVDHLNLMTPFDDNAYVRQALCHETWIAMADAVGETRLVVRSFFAVLYLDGAYVGLYEAMDHPDDEWLEDLGFDRDADLFKAVNHDANFYAWDAWGSPKGSLHQGYERKEGASGTWDSLDALVDFAASSDTPTFVAGMDAWIRPEEFMDWFLFVHVTSADDSGGKNAYIYKSASDPIYRYAPWDFNHSFGQDWMTLRIPSSAYNDFTWANGIFRHLQSDAGTAAELRARLGAFLDGPLSAEALRARLDGYYALIDRSARRDWSRWREAYRSYGGWAHARAYVGDWTEYEGEKAYLYQWVDEREAEMRSVHGLPARRTAYRPALDVPGVLELSGSHVSPPSGDRAMDTSVAWAP